MNIEFGGRKVVKDTCSSDDFLAIGRVVPKRIEQYVLCQCLNCGRYIPTMKRNLANKNCRCRLCMNNNKFEKVNDEISLIIITYLNKEYIYFVDTNMLDELSKHQWRVATKRRKHYAVTGLPKKKTAIYLHQMVYGKVAPKGYTLDHIDGNEYNNRKSNLRLLTTTENAQNVSVRYNNKCGVRGVWYNGRDNDYGSCITMNGIHYYFKYRKTLEEAVLSRYCAEEYFNLEMAKRNPKVKKFIANFSNEEIADMRSYVYHIIQTKQAKQKSIEGDTNDNL